MEPLALISGALGVLLVAFALTTDAVVARRPEPLPAWTLRHRQDIRLTAFGLATAIVLGTLISRLGQGGAG